MRVARQLQILLCTLEPLFCFLQLLPLREPNTQSAPFEALALALDSALLSEASASVLSTLRKRPDTMSFT
jgi:hypothetical protein